LIVGVQSTGRALSVSMEPLSITHGEGRNHQKKEEPPSAFEVNGG